MPEALDPPELQLQALVRGLMWVLEQNSSPVREKYTLLTHEPSLQFPYTDWIRLHSPHLLATYQLPF